MRKSTKPLSLMYDNEKLIVLYRSKPDIYLCSHYRLQVSMSIIYYTYVLYINVPRLYLSNDQVSL